MLDKIILIVAAVSVLFSLLSFIMTICIANSAKKNGKVLKAIFDKPVVAPVCEKTAPALVEAKEEVAVAEAAPEEAVTFAADKGKTLEDKYNELDATAKGYYDQIAAYAAAVEGAKRFKNLRYEEYKIGSMRIVRMLVKRDLVYCEFMIQNSSLRSYVAESKVAVKQAATVIKVVDAAAVDAVKATIDIAVKGIEEAKELKKQIAREKRREKRNSK